MVEPKLGPRGGTPFRLPADIERVEVIAEEGHPAGLRCDGEPEVFLAGSAPGFDERCSRPRWFARRQRTDKRHARSNGRRPWIFRFPFGR